MKKWEYCWETCLDVLSQNERLNLRGEHGWELVSVILLDNNCTRFYWKREIIEKII